MYKSLIKRFSLAFMATSSLIAVSAGSASAADNSSVLDYLTNKVHAKVVSLGNRQGMDSYLVDLPGSNRHQPIYILPDGKHFILGILMDDKGYNFTLEDMVKERQKLQQAQAQLSSVADQVSNMGDGLSSNTLPATSDNPLPLKSSDVSQVKAPAPNSVSQAPLVAEAPPPAVSVDGFRSKVTPAEFIKDAGATAFFTVGPENAPRIYLVADPQCPFCHMAWTKLEPLVKAGKISVQVILTHYLPGSESVVDNLLANPDVDTLWMKGVGSRDGVNVPVVLTPGSADYATYDGYRVNNNDHFASKYQTLFSVNPNDKKSLGVPLMAYVSKDGKSVYATEGLPKPANMDIFLSGILK